MKLKQILSSVLKKLLISRLPLHAREHAHFSFAAWGEDRIMDSWLILKGVNPTEVRYLDVGAAYPVFLSNTYAFYRRGGSGVLVEPDPTQAAELKRIRPRDEVVQAGAAECSGRSHLIRMSSPVFNTFNSDAAEKVVNQSRGWMPYQRQEVVDTIEVAMQSLGDILEKYFSDRLLHILSIDVEGMDYKLLRSIDFNRFRPLIICTEIGTALDHYTELLKPFGYQFVCWTPDNYIFVKE
jgi:FkbM family methyltransferase